MKTRLPVDLILFEVIPGTLLESKSGGSQMTVSGVLQRADAQNQNGRIYPRALLERESKRYSETFIKERRALGELDHPDSSVVNLKNASHNIKEMHFEGDDLIGTVEILTTPAGNILKELLKNKITLGISSRGLGSVKPLEENGEPNMKKLIVQDDFELIGFDFVSNPSTHGAFMSPVNESTGAQETVCTTYCKAQSIMRDILEQIHE